MPAAEGEEAPTAEGAAFGSLGSSPPPEAGERWLGEAETERGSAAGGYTPPHVNVRIPWRLPSYILRQQQGDQT
jgi:hypothetical protein